MPGLKAFVTKPGLILWLSFLFFYLTFLSHLSLAFTLFLHLPLLIFNFTVHYISFVIFCSTVFYYLMLVGAVAVILVFFLPLRGTRDGTLKTKNHP